MDMKLKDRIAFITGASRNIGRAVALGLAAEGADIILTTRDSLDALEEVAREIRQHGTRVLVLRCDVKSTDQVKNSVDMAKYHFGRIDILVNNAVERLETSLTGC